MSEEYKLEEDECVIFRKRCLLGTPASLACRRTGEVMLTNKNVIITKYSLGIFKKSNDEIEVHPVSDIKIYNGKPQVSVKFTEVEIYFKDAEYKIYFSSSFTDAAVFSNAVTELITGKSFANRSSEKVKGSIKLVDNTLGINSVETAVDVLTRGLAKTSFKKLKEKTKASSLLSKAASFLDNNSNTERDNKLISDENTSNDLSDDDVIKLKKLKKLFDEGIITEEEFNLKKKEILKL